MQSQLYYRTEWLGLRRKKADIASRDSLPVLQETQPAPPKTYPDPPKGRESELTGLANVA